MLIALRIILLVMAASFTTAIAHGQVAISGGREKQEAKKQSLEIKVRILTPSACLGSALKLEVEVTNTGAEAVRLNRRSFENSYSFSRLPRPEKEQDQEGFIVNVWASSNPEDMFYLAPGMTHIETRDWSLDEDNLTVGEYALEFWIYETKQELQFELYDCGLKEIKEQ